jgi:hypothetical protein
MRHEYYDIPTIYGLLRIYKYVTFGQATAIAHFSVKCGLYLLPGFHEYWFSTERIQGLTEW